MKLGSSSNVHGKQEYELGQKVLSTIPDSDSEQIYCRTCKVKTNLAEVKRHMGGLSLGSKPKRFTFLTHIK